MKAQPAAAVDAPAADSWDPLAGLDALLSGVGLSRRDAGAAVSFAGKDPFVPSRHRLGACISLPIMAVAVAAVAFHRHRGGAEQDLHLDLRQAMHSINPGAFWHPTVNEEPASHALALDNPFLVTPYRTADGRWVMASGVYPHLAAKWCRFLDVPPDSTRVAAAIATWVAADLEDTANAAGLPVCVVRTPSEWRDHRQGSLLSGQPVVTLERIGEAPARPGRSQRGRCGRRAPPARSVGVRRSQPARRHSHGGSAGGLLPHPAAWPDPILVPRGSSRPEWR